MDTWHYVNTPFQHFLRFWCFRNKLGYTLRPGDFILNCFSSSLIKPSETASKSAIIEPGAARPGTEAAKLEKTAPKVGGAAESESAASVQEIRIKKDLIENSDDTNAESMRILQDQKDQSDQKGQQVQKDQSDLSDPTDPLVFKDKLKGTEKIMHMVSCKFLYLKIIYNSIKL